MEVISRDRKVFTLSRYNDYVLSNDYGTLIRSSYTERTSLPVENKVISIKVSKNSLIALKYDNGIEFIEIHIDSLKKRTLVTSSELEHLFEKAETAYSDCVMDFEYHEGKLVCIFKEENRRFLAKINLVTSETEILAEWTF